MSKSGSLAIASPPSAIEALTPPCLCMDIETPPSMSNNRFGQAVIHKLAAFRPDSGDKLVVQGVAPALPTELDALTEGAGFVLGHNLRRHDLPLLGQVFPNLKLLALPVVDTLELSPLAFPENPYRAAALSTTKSARSATWCKTTCCR
jgi:ATP-dependent DNA helicase RecQ